ncbi:MAG: PepSY-associated TM helix domain-containing protein [Caulobacteraceae bacterium]|nr:PepSY-associated TM helix domain-containing protein [Caulobacteraceae bacterium]
MTARALRLAHRYVSLVFAALWLMQAATGAILVFHWELDDWSVRGPAGPLDVAAFSRSLVDYDPAHPGHHVVSVYASGGEPGRFDVLVSNPAGHRDVLRVDGRGEALRVRPWDYDDAHIGLFQIITTLHQTLFADDLGKLFLGASAVVLFSNLVVGLTLAWPRVGQWARALRPAPGKTAAMGLFAWHRAAGLWLGLIALVAVGSGITMGFEDPLAALIGDARPAPAVAAAAAIPQRASPVTPAEALEAAMARYPASPLASLIMPGPDQPWYRVRVRQPGEARRAQGMTTLYVSARDGRVLADYDALKAPLATRVYDSLYAIHTGEAFGLVGRWLALVVGVWLTAMIVLGLALWQARRRLRAGRRPQASGG